MNLRSRTSLIKKLLTEKEYRDAYVAELIKNGIPFQIRTLRDQRGWTQAELGEKAKKRPNAITRLEDPNYGKVTLRTLLEIASAFEVGLLVKFVPFSRLVREYEDVSPIGLSARSITEQTESRALMAWVEREEKTLARKAKATAKVEAETQGEPVNQTAAKVLQFPQPAQPTMQPQSLGGGGSAPKIPA